MALSHARTLICALPNIFNAIGEHVHMAWNSQEQFDKLFSEFNVERIDSGMYPKKLLGAFKHPIWSFTSKQDNTQKEKYGEISVAIGENPVIKTETRGRKKRLTNPE